MGLVAEELDRAAFAVFPNPSAGRFEVLVDLGLGDVDYLLTDLNGRLLAQDALHPVNGTAELHFESLPKGMYLLTLRSQGRVLGTERLMVGEM
jgi:hypothetical protein